MQTLIKHRIQKSGGKIISIPFPSSTITNELPHITPEFSRMYDELGLHPNKSQHNCSRTMNIPRTDKTKVEIFSRNAQCHVWWKPSTVSHHKLLIPIVMWWFGLLHPQGPRKLRTPLCEAMSSSLMMGWNWVYL